MKKIIFTLLIITQIFASNIEQKIDKIEFVGLASISDKVALEILELKIGDLTDTTKINNSIKEFYKYGYFKDIFVEYDSGTLSFHFKEKPTISALSVKGYKTREDDLKLLYAGMNLKKGSMYGKKRVENAKLFLLRQLDTEGYIGSVIEVETEPVNDTSVKVTFSVNKGYELIASKVNYFGATKIDYDDFEEATANKEHEFMGWFIGRNDGEIHLEQLEYDTHRIQDVYFQNGYLDAEVTSPVLNVDFNTYEGELDFHIKEGNQYIINKINIYVDNSIINDKAPKRNFFEWFISLFNSSISSVEEFKKDMFLIENKRFNSAYLRKDIEALKILVANEGYAYTRVIEKIKKDKENKTVEVSLNVIPGQKVYINDVKIAGNTKTLDRVIRRNIYLASGDLYSQTDYQDSIGNLKRTGYFDNVSISKRRVTEDKMDLVVNVHETNTGNIAFGGGYGSYDGFTITTSVEDKNIFGSGKNLGIKFEKSSKRKNYKLYLSNPALNDSLYSGSIDLHKDASTTENTTGSYTTDTTGYGIGIGKKLTRFIYIGLNYAHDNETTKDDKNGTITNDNYVVNSITPYLSFNNTDDYYTPRSGHKASIYHTIAGLGGDAKYTKTFYSYRYFFGLEKYIDYDLILRYKANLGILRDKGNVRFSDSYYLGGPRTVRGYQYSAFGPTNENDPIYDKLFTHSIEASIPLFTKAKMRLSFFYDEGKIGKGKYEFTKRGRGIVIEWFTPMGPLQFIFSRPINPAPDDDISHFEFALGQTF
jgi:outer membrane protein insertion porin family